MNTPQTPPNQQPEPAGVAPDIGCPTTPTPGVDLCDALMSLARLLGRQAAAEFLNSTSFNPINQKEIAA